MRKWRFFPVTYWFHRIVAIRSIHHDCHYEICGPVDWIIIMAHSICVLCVRCISQWSDSNCCNCSYRKWFDKFFCLLSWLTHSLQSNPFFRSTAVYHKCQDAFLSSHSDNVLENIWNWTLLKSLGRNILPQFDQFWVLFDFKVLGVFLAWKFWNCTKRKSLWIFWESKYSFSSTPWLNFNNVICILKLPWLICSYVPLYIKIGRFRPSSVVLLP